MIKLDIKNLKQHVIRWGSAGLVIAFSILASAPNLVANVVPYEPVLGARVVQAGSINDILSDQLVGDRIADPVPHPKLIGDNDTIKLSAQSAIAFDRRSKQVLFEKNPDQVRYPASTTKIASALVVIDQMDLSRVVQAPKNIQREAEGSVVGISSEERYQVFDLLQGMMIGSGNDAALVLAESIDGGKEVFVAKMNELTKEVGLDRTHFDNPVGYDGASHFSTARDLAVLSDYAMKNSVFRNTVGTVGGLMYRNTNKETPVLIRNTNQLLGTVEGVNGVKTGWTENAKGVLVTSVNRGGNEIIVVVMGSDNREDDSRKVIEWVYKSYQW